MFTFLWFCCVIYNLIKMEGQIISENKDSDVNAVGIMGCDSGSKLSKRQQKKIARHQKWLLQKPLKRAKEKEKLKAKRKEAREKGIVLGPNRKQLKLAKMTDSPCKLRIAFDMSLDHLMTEMELAKCLKQLHRCYSINRRADAPLQLYITSFLGPIHKKMSATSGCLKWDLHYREQPYSEVFEKDQIVYLTSDSPNVVEQLDHEKAYIIGGLVDHNRHKGICYEKVLEAQLQHARLPIDEYIVMKTRKVLTIDQVFLILLRASEGKSWAEAFLDVIPKRKNVELKCNTTDSSSSDDKSADGCNEHEEMASQEFVNTEENPTV